MPAALVGQIAALATSFAWSFTSIFFTLAGRRVGPPVVNRTRLLIATLLVIALHWITLGQPVPLGAERFRWGWLALSGLIGFVIGDSFLFQAFVLIGPRLSMLLMALAPVFSTLLGWVILRETLTPVELLGIALAVAGTALVVTDRPRTHEPTPDPATLDAAERPRQYAVGLLFGLGAAVGQASGLFFSKLGLVGDFPALSGSLIRLIVATVAIWIITVASRQVRPTVDKLRADPRALLILSGGAVTGPVLGVWLSLVAVKKAPLGIAATLTSLAPVLLIPISYVFFKERIGLRAVVGTLIAVAGTVVLFL